MESEAKMNNKVALLSCKKCKKDLTDGDDFRIIEGQAYCIDCSENIRLQRYKRFNKEHPAFVLKKTKEGFLYRKKEE